MKIGIIGGGAIGLLMGAYLAEEHAVTIVTRSEGQAEDIRHNGIHLVKDGQEYIKKVEAAPISVQSLNDFDLIVVAVKQYALEEIVSVLEGTNSSLFFVQNGMSHVELVKRLSHDKTVFVGVVEHGALKTNHHTVVHTGVGLVKVSAYQQNQWNFPITSNADFPIVYEENPHDMLTKKLVVNAMINPLTAVLGVPNGDLLNNGYYKQLFDSLFEEISGLLQIEDYNGMKVHIESICRKTARNYSSMLRDIQEQRPTEIDSILGYVLKVAAEKNWRAPITSSLYLMVKGKE
ncbi:2-dehydropantoate 2-reductase [Bacillus sp. AGMB 02131]|uniref:2-dehydropantoate 2-reductase n=1 Tax=Peribacillus faecalis TaxID=2772559 RepID=A0A927CTB8_9BACI|nr:2-dehydropantoate 2-reductase [Peribacillus faecalis]MBD3106834.1 2-dehydropantoate 2-reductase [Peribacillus faecalis]